VNLHSIVSVSSVLNLHADNDGAAETTDTDRPTDGIVCTIDQHEESVYKAAWSSADPWIYASLSYDGRLLVNQVPREYKYKIIL
jgi:WD40 repeat protein